MKKTIRKMADWLRSRLASRKVVLTNQHAPTPTMVREMNETNEGEPKKVLDSRLEQIKDESCGAFYEDGELCFKKKYILGNSFIVVEYCEPIPGERTGFYRLSGGHISTTAAYDCQQRLHEHIAEEAKSFGFLSYNEEDKTFAAPPLHQTQGSENTEFAWEKPTETEPQSEPLLSEKQKWMLEFCVERRGEFISPTRIGREYGKSVKGKHGWGSQHASKTLTGLVLIGLLEKNEFGHYKAN